MIRSFKDNMLHDISSVAPRRFLSSAKLSFADLWRSLAWKRCGAVQLVRRASKDRWSNKGDKQFVSVDDRRVMESRHSASVLPLCSGAMAAQILKN